MKKCVLLLFLSATSLVAQNDLKEYGYFGKVKRMHLVRTVQSNGEERISHVIQSFDPNGFEDTIVFKHYAKNNLISQTIRIYQHNDLKKLGWKEYNANYQLISYAIIEWLSDTLYKEKTYHADSTCQGESLCFLNKLGNSYKNENWKMDSLCHPIFESLVLLNRPKYGAANRVSMRYENESEFEITNYEILKKDSHKNPTKTKGTRNQEIIWGLRTYTYYQ